MEDMGNCRIFKPVLDLQLACNYSEKSVWDRRVGGWIDSWIGQSEAVLWVTALLSPPDNIQEPSVAKWPRWCELVVRCWCWCWCGWSTMPGLTLQMRRSSAKERANAQWEPKMREPSSLARHDSWNTRKLPPSYLHGLVNGCLANLWQRRDSKYVRQMNGRCKDNRAGKWHLLPLTLLWLKIAILRVSKCGLTAVKSTWIVFTHAIEDGIEMWFQNSHSHTIEIVSTHCITT